MKLAELAARLGCELRGDGGVEVTGVAGIEQAGPGDVTFLVNPRYAAHLRTHYPYMYSLILRTHPLRTDPNAVVG